MARALAPPAARGVSRVEYERMADLGFFQGEHVELVRGTVVRMAPIGPAHASAVQRLAELLLPRLLGRATVRIQQPFLAFDDSEPEPDVAIVPPGRYADRHPDRAMCVIEVAESSLAYDLETKAPLYAASGVEQYWVVDVAGGVAHAHARPEGDRYAVVRQVVAGQALGIAAFPDVVVEVAGIVG